VSSESAALQPKLANLAASDVVANPDAGNPEPANLITQVEDLLWLYFLFFCFTFCVGN